MGLAGGVGSGHGVAESRGRQGAPKVGRRPCLHAFARLCGPPQALMGERGRDNTRRHGAHRAFSAQGHLCSRVLERARVGPRRRRSRPPAQATARRWPLSASKAVNTEPACRPRRSLRTTNISLPLSAPKLPSVPHGRDGPRGVGTPGWSAGLRVERRGSEAHQGSRCALEPSEIVYREHLIGVGGIQR